MTFDIRTANLRAINSMTKYPSIPTYHALDPKTGCLLDETVPFTGDVVATEKIDGCSARLIRLPDGTYIIGSREELLYAKGDIIGDKTLGIVEALKPFAEALPSTPYVFEVLYLEVYGSKALPAWKQYGNGKRAAWRLFDAACYGAYDEILSWPVERIASWREHGGQPFAHEKELNAAVQGFGAAFGLELVPRLFTVHAEDIPTDIAGMRQFLGENLPETTVALDGAAPGRAEGVVFRTLDRLLIAKARFQDYERTLRRRGAGQRMLGAQAGASS